MRKSVNHIFLLFILFQVNLGICGDLTLNKLATTNNLDPNNYKMMSDEQAGKQIGPTYHYHYLDRYHSVGENLKNLGTVYAITWGLYFATQPEAWHEGSWEAWKKNFGKVVFDQDEPFWNWFVHPFAGSQLYLFYRANGYSRIDSLGMSFISALLFEFTVEIYTEPASIQDIFQTPVFGSILGLGLETASLYFLNSGNAAGKVLGHVLNLYTLFWFYEGKIKIVPMYDGPKSAAITFTETF
ncbi:MAG: hypothetical protein DRQ88_03250 [Epsilonproteobacteria bacterium]|nr:MAG: hypothetical protein DRQ89_01510 [Campylobacterota bacterium]RLA67336.1 MAG: hypothetical protein DRQ88_03250 [Campylobacterota bacterium]